MDFNSKGNLHIVQSCLMREEKKKGERSLSNLEISHKIRISKIQMIGVIFAFAKARTGSSKASAPNCSCLSVQPVLGREGKLLMLEINQLD